MYLASVSTRLLLHSCDSWDLSLIHGDYDTPIKDISWSNDGKYLLQVNPKGLVEVLSATDKEIRVLQHIPCQNTCAAVFQREAHRQIGIGNLSGQVLIWDTKYKNIRKSFTTPSTESPVKFLDFNTKNNWIASALENGETIVYGLTTNSEVCTVKIPHSKSVSAMHFHGENRSLLGLASDEGSLLVRDLLIGKDRFFAKKVHCSPVSDFVFSPINKDFMATCGYDRYFHLYDLRSGCLLGSNQTNQSLTCMDMNHKSELAVGTRKGSIFVYDLRNYNEPIKIVTNHSSEIKRVAYRPFVDKLTREASLKESINPLLVQYSNRSECSDMMDYFNASNSPYDKRKATPGDDATKVKKGKGDAPGDKSDSFLMILGLESQQATPERSASVSNVNCNTIGTPQFGGKPFFGAQPSTIKSSTPLMGKSDLASAPTPSPIVRPARPRNPLDENINVDEPPPAEERAPVGDLVAALGDELKDLIRNSVADLSEEFRNSQLRLGLTLTKQKLFIENEIDSLGRKIQDMQMLQNVLLEENKKLLLEIEILKSQKFNS